MKKDKKKKGEKGLKAFIDKHYGEDLKPNKIRMPLKIGADVLSAGTGTAIAAGIGKGSFFLGAGLVVIGRLVNDKTGLLAILGSSIVGYSVAMGKENSDNGEEDLSGVTLGSVQEGIKARFSRLKENWLHATYLNKVVGESDTEDQENESSDESVGAIDLSTLDQFEKMVEESAVKSEAKRIQNEDQKTLLEEFNDHSLEDQTKLYESDSEVFSEEGNFDPLSMATI